MMPHAARRNIFARFTPSGLLFTCRVRRCPAGLTLTARAVTDRAVHDSAVPASRVPALTGRLRSMEPADQSGGTRGFLPAVEGMRACAAMGVVLTHVAFQTGT